MQNHLIYSQSFKWRQCVHGFFSPFYSIFLLKFEISIPSPRSYTVKGHLSVQEKLIIFQSQFFLYLIIWLCNSKLQWNPIPIWMGHKWLQKIGAQILLLINHRSLKCSIGQFTGSCGINWHFQLVLSCNYSVFWFRIKECMVFENFWHETALHINYLKFLWTFHASYTDSGITETRFLKKITFILFSIVEKFPHNNIILAICIGQLLLFWSLYAYMHINELNYLSL